MHQPSPPLLQYVVPAGIVIVVLALRMMRMRQARRLRLESLWIVPAVYTAIAVMMLAAQMPQGPWAWALIAAGFGAGAAIGWQRGRSIRISVDPETHQLDQRASPFTMLLLVALVLLRAGLRSMATAEAAAWHLSAALITDIFVAMVVGLLAMSRLEMYLRGKRLLDETRRMGGGATKPLP